LLSKDSLTTGGSAFASSKSKREKQWIASTLMRLGEPSPQAYLDFLIDGAKAARDRRESPKNPPKTIAQYLEALGSQGLEQSASVLRECME